MGGVGPSSRWAPAWAVGTDIEINEVGLDHLDSRMLLLQRVHIAPHRVLDGLARQRN